MIGIIGAEIDITQRKVYVKLARQWSREQINKIPDNIQNIYSKIQWEDTIIDQQTGQHFIQDLKRCEMPMQVITTQKNIKDPDVIEKIQTMDKVEMIQLMLVLRKNHQIIFPEEPSEDMSQLEHQMSVFTEHKTEAGGIDYFAPGDEFDNLTKALLMLCFAARRQLVAEYDEYVMGCPIDETPETNYAMGQFGSVSNFI